MYSHVMTDLETLGNVPGSIICSVGAVVFDIDIDTGELGAEFYRNVDRASCEEVGLTADPLTEAWWDRPENREAKNFLQLDPRTAYFLGDFDPYSITRLGTHHNALDDAKHQVECVHRAYLRIKGTAA